MSAMNLSKFILNWTVAKNLKDNYSFADNIGLTISYIIISNLFKC